MKNWNENVLTSIDSETMNKAIENLFMVASRSNNNKDVQKIPKKKIENMGIVWDIDCYL